MPFTHCILGHGTDNNDQNGANSHDLYTAFQTHRFVSMESISCLENKVLQTLKTPLRNQKSRVHATFLPKIAKVRKTPTYWDLRQMHALALRHEPSP